MRKLTREEAAEYAWKADWEQRMEAFKYLINYVGPHEMTTLWNYKWASRRFNWTDKTDEAIRQGIMRASYRYSRPDLDFGPKE